MWASQYQFRCEPASQARSKGACTCPSWAEWARVHGCRWVCPRRATTARPARLDRTLSLTVTRDRCRLGWNFQELRSPPRSDLQKARGRRNSCRSGGSACCHQPQAETPGELRLGERRQQHRPLGKGKRRFIRSASTGCRTPFQGAGGARVRLRAGGQRYCCDRHQTGGLWPLATSPRGSGWPADVGERRRGCPDDCKGRQQRSVL